MPSNRDYDSQGDGGFDGFFDDHHQYYDTYAGRQHRDRAPPAQHNPNTSTNTDLSASQVRRQQSAGSNSVNGGGPYSEVSNTSMAGRPLMGIGATNTDYEAGPADSRSHLATEPTRRNTPHRKGDEGREEDLETGQPASSFWKGKRGRTLVRPERQPAPQPGDPHYHEYLLNAPEVTAPAGPRSRNHRRNVLTRGDNTALTAITNTQAFRNSQYNQNHGTSGRFAGKPKKYSCPGPWTLYSRIITFWAPPPILGLFGLKSPQMQQAWREKIALISVILFLCGCVAFMTFALQQVLCPKISGQSDRVRYSEINEDSVVINGYSYNISRYMHPASSETGDQPTLLVNQPDNKVNASFMDLSLMFQNPNANCKGILKYQKDFMNSDQNVGYIFPCQMVAIDTTSDKIDTGANFNTALCHNKQNQRNALAKLERKPVYYTWEDINRKGQYMSIYNGMVLDILRLNWLVEQVQMHPTMKKVLNGNYRGQDLTMFFASTDVKVGKCLQDIVSVGFIDTSAIGCIASSIVMYVSLIVILAVVFAKFFMAVYFGWFMSRRLGAIKPETPEERKQRLEQIEAWADKNTHFGERENLNPQYSVTQTPGHSKRLPWLPTISRYSQFNPGEDIATRRQGRRGRASLNPASVTSAHINSMYMHDNRSTASPIGTPNRHYSGTPAMDPSASAFDDSTRDLVQSSRQSQIVDFASYPVVEYDAVSHPRQPETETLWDFELAYTLLLVTCYSEGSHGIRTTLDSLAGTDYPSSHKCIFVICDGLIKGEGEDMYTPDVCLSMMKDFVIPPDRVQPYTYVAIASGAKRRNMAKIYAGFYAPNEDSPESAKKHPVPMVLVVKCGTPEESSDKKPGNRGKRDSQVVLMNFLQHV
ncbi:Chitin synthase, class 3, partial [Spiromyces aspiralis]